LGGAESHGLDEIRKAYEKTGKPGQIYFLGRCLTPNFKKSPTLKNPRRIP